MILVFLKMRRKYKGNNLPESTPERTILDNQEIFNENF